MAEVTVLDWDCDKRISKLEATVARHQKVILDVLQLVADADKEHTTNILNLMQQINILSGVK